MNSRALRRIATHYAQVLTWVILLVVLTACRDGSAEVIPLEDDTSGVLAIIEQPDPEAPSPLPQSPTPTPEPYGLALPTPTFHPYGYPQPTTTISALTPDPTHTPDDDIAYLPLTIGGVQGATRTMTASATISSTISVPQTATASLPATPTPIVPTPTAAPIPTLDVFALKGQLEGTGQQLAFSKIGFHVTFLEEKGMLDQWMRELDSAGIPFYLKTVDNAEPLFKAQQLIQASGVPHTLVFRATGGVPNYDLPPAEAAREHWIFHRDKFPPELDPELVWVETVNEVDKNRSTWLAEFALETARLAMADGFRWAAFGWAPGEPEPEHWRLPAMLEFLRLAGENPDRLAIALHEGSLSAENIRQEYPYRLGRFLQLFQICDEYGIPRPTVLITEWGWEYNNIPALDQALNDISWAANLYAHFPQVKGAAIWNLGTGCCFGDVSEEVDDLIDPLRRFNLTTSFAIRALPEQEPADPRLYQ